MPNETRQRWLRGAGAGVVLAAAALLGADAVAQLASPERVWVLWGLALLVGAFAWLLDRLGAAGAYGAAALSAAVLVAGLVAGPAAPGRAGELGSYDLAGVLARLAGQPAAYAVLGLAVAVALRAAARSPTR